MFWGVFFLNKKGCFPVVIFVDKGSRGADMPIIPQTGKERRSSDSLIEFLVHPVESW